MNDNALRIKTRLAKAPRRARGQGLMRLFENRKALFGFIVVAIFVILALFAKVITPGDPANFVDRGNLPPSVEHPLGTMAFGQDGLAQLLWGARASLGIGFASGLVATFLSTLIGMVAGYFRGWVDDVLSLLINIFLVMPGLPLAIVLAAYLPASPYTIIIVLSISGWAWGARVMRSQTLTLREKDFVSAAVVSGESSLRIIFSEIMPNMVSLVVSNLIGATIYGIGAEVGLKFLGLGNISSSSWGSILYWARSTAALTRGAWWAFLPAGLAVSLVGFALAMINYALDEITNPRLRTETESAHVLKRFVHGKYRSTPVAKNVQ